MKCWKVEITVCLSFLETETVIVMPFYGVIGRFQNGCTFSASTIYTILIFPILNLHCVCLPLK
jgi:hypothetical protein